MSSIESIFISDPNRHEAVLASDLVEQTQEMLDSLLELRKSKKLTQQDVADLLGITRTAVTAFERYDADPKMSTLIRYALAIGARLNISVEDGAAWAKSRLAQDQLADTRVNTELWRGNDSVIAFMRTRLEKAATQ